MPSVIASAPFWDARDNSVEVGIAHAYLDMRSTRNDKVLSRTPTASPKLIEETLRLCQGQTILVRCILSGALCEGRFGGHLIDAGSAN